MSPHMYRRVGCHYLQYNIFWDITATFLHKIVVEKVDTVTFFVHFVYQPLQFMPNHHT